MLWCRALISTTWALTCVCARASSACVYVPTRGTCVYSVIGRTCFDAETLGFICRWWKSAAMRNYTPSWYQVPSHRFEREKNSSGMMTKAFPWRHCIHCSATAFLFFVFLFFCFLFLSLLALSDRYFAARVEQSVPLWQTTVYHTDNT